MSTLLEEIIADLKARRIDYEEYLKRIAHLAKGVQSGGADSAPTGLRTPGIRAVYNNVNVPGEPAGGAFIRDVARPGEVALDARLALAMGIDAAVRKARPDAWRGHLAKESEIKRALLPLLGNDSAEVERIFLVIKQQPEY